MTQQEVILTLKKEVASNPAADAVLHVLALRKRARESLTVSGLSQRMKSEGFEFDKKDYEALLKLFSRVGIGQLHVDSKGNIIGLRGIKTKLQSLGEAVIGQNAKLKSYKQRNRFDNLVATAKMIEQPKQDTRELTGFPVSITVVINGKPVNFRVPKELTESEIADLVVRFRDKGNA